MAKQPNVIQSNRNGLLSFNHRSTPTASFSSTLPEEKHNTCNVFTFFTRGPVAVNSFIDDRTIREQNCECKNAKCTDVTPKTGFKVEKVQMNIMDIWTGTYESESAD